MNPTITVITIPARYSITFPETMVNVKGKPDIPKVITVATF
ncbi:hypothetical protein SSYM_0966 [Serratia symbiotica str. Tucson]|uniref:Uncharacterized protein n=1 Tax=Serratia symbiotica str. Tucson TaxID=914128 RepID=E9CL72_9GAMM|nr:hypothetical protein SSYM_0966 [Serratia symbiotica str. Tucson]